MMLYFRSDECTSGTTVAAAGRRAGRELAAQEAGERVAEVARAQSVDERVHRRVAVAEPEEDVEHYRGRAVGAERAGEIDGEERRPAQHETADDKLRWASGSLTFVDTKVNDQGHER